MKASHYLTNIANIPELTNSEKEQLHKVTELFAFRTNSYYQSLIDWSDPDDPIRRIIIPSLSELTDWGRLDASDEGAYTPVPGLEHKYASTALLLVTDVCGGYCRFCFRKRLFMPENDEVTIDITPGLEYIKDHPEISNVLLTGGDPLILSTRKLSDIFCRLAEIEHVKLIRIGSKIPALNPMRILNDPTLLDAIRQLSAERCVYLMAHFNHPRELNREAIESLSLMRSAGAVPVNQTPLIRGVNDNPDTLQSLFNTLSFIGVPPYYVFQCRPTLGNEGFSVPIEDAYRIFATAQSRCSGLARRARFVMSHSTGKVEIVGISEGCIYMRYHQAVSPKNSNRMLVFPTNPSARWLDDYESADRAEKTDFRPCSSVKTESPPCG